jgi:hypothetical protein
MCRFFRRQQRDRCTGSARPPRTVVTVTVARSGARAAPLATWQWPRGAKLAGIDAQPHIQPPCSPRCQNIPRSESTIECTTDGHVFLARQTMSASRCRIMVTSAGAAMIPVPLKCAAGRGVSPLPRNFGQAELLLGAGATGCRSDWGDNPSPAMGRPDSRVDCRCGYASSAPSARSSAPLGQCCGGIVTRQWSRSNRVFVVSVANGVRKPVGGGGTRRGGGPGHAPEPPRRVLPMPAGQATGRAALRAAAVSTTRRAW